MDNDKLFEFMEKIYVEMQQGFKNVNSKLDSLESRVDCLEGEVKKNSLKLDTLENKVDTIAEVQQNHMKQNDENHVEIVEMLGDRIDITQKAVRMITKAK